MAAEIDASAVRFQQDTFGVGGLVSCAEPERLALDGSFDVILAASFLATFRSAPSSAGSGGSSPRFRRAGS
jgi:hypothetical protein